MSFKAIVVGVLTLWMSAHASAQLCENGQAAGFPCDGIDLIAFMSLDQLGAGGLPASDLWGWTDPASGREFVLIGLASGTAFVEITNPIAPLLIGNLPAHGAPSTWRDIKVFSNHAYIVSEADGHGMQVFDLNQLLGVSAPPSVFAETAHYADQGLSNAHNIAINEQTGFGYIVGSHTCSSGLHIVNLAAPQAPTFAGCFAEDGYTHDAQCILYDGADTEHRGSEICFAYNEDTLTIVDVSIKSAPRMLSRTSYDGVAYTHQGWVTDDHLFLLQGDELDETTLGHPTVTRVWNIVDLDRPGLVGLHTASTAAIDHNLYVRGRHLYHASYRAGLRVLSLDRVAEGVLQPVGFFDVYPADDAPEFNGAWSVYPFFLTGVVALSDVEQGLFLLNPAVATSR